MCSLSFPKLVWFSAINANRHNQSSPHHTPLLAQTHSPTYNTELERHGKGSPGHAAEVEVGEGEQGAVNAIRAGLAGTVLEIIKWGGMMSETVFLKTQSNR